MTNRKKSSLANRVLALSDRARAIYQKKDGAFQELLDACQPGDVIETKQGRFEIVDNFAGRNVGYRPASFHRFELKEVKMGKAAVKKGAVKHVELTKQTEAMPHAELMKQADAAKQTELSPHADAADQFDAVPQAEAANPFDAVQQFEASIATPVTGSEVLA